MRGVYFNFVILHGVNLCHSVPSSLSFLSPWYGGDFGSSYGTGFGDDYGQFFDGLGFGSGGGNLVALAQEAVFAANTALTRQHSDGGQAVFQTKNSFAQTAAAAAATAQAALTGKQVIVANLLQQARDARSRLEGELQQLNQAGRSVSSARQTAKQSEQQVRASTRAFNVAQATANHASRAAQEARTQYGSQNSMVSQAKNKLAYLSRLLEQARADLHATQQAVQQAAAAAQTAQANANSHKAGSHY